MAYKGTVRVDKSFLIEEAREAISGLRLQEKKQSSLQGSVDVEHILDNHSQENASLLEQLQHEVFPEAIRNQAHVSKKNKLRHKVRRAIYKTI